MNTGRTCKNLTDGLLVAVAVLALICLVVKIVGFEEEYSMKHPATNEEISVSSPFDDPYTETYLKLFATFSMAAIIGFASRGSAWVSVLASVCAIVISLNYFADGIVQKYGFVYVLIAVTSLGGSLVYAYYHYAEKKKTEGECKACEEN